jgi:proteasome lid subunit RPN8/RPN11
LGLFGRLFGKKGKERWVRADYRSLPREQWTEDEEEHWWQTCSDEEYWAHWEKWSRETYDHPTVTKIKRGVIELAREAAKASFPQEFAALLRIKRDTIQELILLPGTIQGDEHAIFMFGNAPVDISLRGTVHSHPDPHPYPSDADFELFEAHGVIHLIFCEPYGPGDWRAYDHTGLPTHLDVVA